MRTALLVLVLISLAVWGLAVPPAAQAARTWTILGGGEKPDLSVVANAFYPRRLEVAVGDTVTWQISGFHNVAFLSGGRPPDIEIRRGGKQIINPAVMLPAGGKVYTGTGYLNSGLPPDPTKPLAYSLTFNKEGRYGYLCLVHGPSMGGEIVVGGPTTNDPDEILASAKQQQAQTIKIGDTAFAALKYDVMQGKVTVPMIGSVRDGYSILRFTREPLVITRGTQVTWEMADPFEIHTVTFGSGAKPIDYVIPEPQPGGPPLLVVNTRITTPTRRTTYDGTGFVNSGVLFPPGLAPNLPTRFSLTFTKTGTYQYYCSVHLPFMMGSVVVR